jgi:hypothetical protein
MKGEKIEKKKEREITYISPFENSLVDYSIPYTLKQ